MSLPNTPSLLGVNNPQLAQSADSLESALAQFSKLAASIEHPAANPVVSNPGRGFDEWLASDLQYGALLSSDETPLIDSPSSLPAGSPLLEYEMFHSTGAQPLFEYPGSSSARSYSTHVLGPHDQSSSQGLTTVKLQQAAAALNIPWSQELERAVAEQTKKISTVTVSSLSVPRQSDASLSHIRSTVKRSYTPEDVDSEEILAKRAKNTDAARRSRLKKLVKMEGLEVKVTDLEATNHRLNTRIAVLETEKNRFLIREAEQNARIAQLETKIMEAHLTLKTRVP